MDAMARAPRRLAAQTVSIPGPAGGIEALVESAAHPPCAIAVVCHPHPQHAGTMLNKVVHTLARHFARLGANAVRFNFRGVGESEGEFGGGDGETEDALAVIDWARGRWPGLALYLAGFSFGAMVALRAAPRRSATGLATIAPAVDRFDFEVRYPRCPWLVVQGRDDDVVSAAAVERWCANVSPPPSLLLMENTGHYFHGRLPELGRRVDDFFAPGFCDRAVDGGIRAC